MLVFRRCLIGFWDAFVGVLLLVAARARQLLNYIRTRPRFLYKCARFFVFGVFVS